MLVPDIEAGDIEVETMPADPYSAVIAALHQIDIQLILLPTGVLHLLGNSWRRLTVAERRRCWFG